MFAEVCEPKATGCSDRLPSVLLTFFGLIAGQLKILAACTWQRGRLQPTQAQQSPGTTFSTASPSSSLLSLALSVRRSMSSSLQFSAVSSFAPTSLHACSAGQTACHPSAVISCRGGLGRSRRAASRPQEHLQHTHTGPPQPFSALERPTGGGAWRRRLPQRPIGRTVQAAATSAPPPTLMRGGRSAARAWLGRSG